MARKEKEVSEEWDRSCQHLPPLNKNYSFSKKCHDYKTNLSIIHLKDAVQLFFSRALLSFSFTRKNDCKNQKNQKGTKDYSSSCSWWWRGLQWWWQLESCQFKGNLPHGCRIVLHIRCQDAEAVQAWMLFGKEKLPSHWRVGCSAGERGHMERWVCGTLCTFGFAEDSEMKVFLYLCRSDHCCCAMSWELQAGISILETEPLYCFPGGGTDPIQLQKECFMLTPLGRPGGIWP